ncbi:MAG: hypothetical protein K0A89_05865 [ANME-2 cluster archaeon]|nr:hypothetical protein [ANME-2 cluster archaeon]MCL7476271.1 hypothetical protein [ANME-2 cluster archaeon]MDF1532684.1 hypothetical protein [ANME-2 cluster archaeon]MDW7774786.1 hypothetical protein [Methanosarcinales archaeon]
MSEFEKNSIDNVAFTILVMLLVASGISAILGFVMFVHSQYLVLFAVLFIVFLAIAIVLSFLVK